jgi:WD40 repeat protein
MHYALCWRTRRQGPEETKREKKIHVCSKAINAVRFFDDGKVWSQGRDGFVKQWDLASEQCVSAHELGCHSFVPMSTLQASGDQVCLTAIPDSEDMKGVLLLRLDARARDVSVAKRWEGLPKQGMCMRLSLSCNPGPVVLCGYENGDLVVHDVDKGWSKTTSIPVDEPKFPVTALAMNSGIGCAGGSESQLFTFQARFVFDVSFVFVRFFSPSVFFPLSDDGSLLFSEVRHSIPSKGVNDLCIREDKKLFASAGWDGKVRLFGLTKKKERMIGVCSFHSEPVNALSFQSKSKLLAAASSDGKISLWDL